MSGQTVVGQNQYLSACLIADIVRRGRHFPIGQKSAISALNTLYNPIQQEEGQQQ
jgi:hypothetical protein